MSMPTVRIDRDPWWSKPVVTWDGERLWPGEGVYVQFGPPDGSRWETWFLGVDASGNTVIYAVPYYP